VWLLHDFEYGIKAHSLSAKQKGAGEDQINSLKDFERGPLFRSGKARLPVCGPAAPFAPRDRRCVLCAREARLQLEILELTAVAAAFEFFPRFIGALRVPTTPPPRR